MSSKGVLRKSVQLRMGVPRLCVCVAQECPEKIVRPLLSSRNVARTGPTKVFYSKCHPTPKKPHPTVCSSLSDTTSIERPHCPDSPTNPPLLTDGHPLQRNTPLQAVQVIC